MAQLSLKETLAKLLKNQTIYVGDYSARAKQINTNLSTSSSDSDWLQATIKAICQDYPGLTEMIFKGKVRPNSVGYFEICIYNTSTLSNGLPQYAYGTWRKWENTFCLISTNAYVFNIVTK